MFPRILPVLVVVALLAGAGCKKDEPLEEAAIEPEPTESVKTPLKVAKGGEEPPGEGASEAAAKDEPATGEGEAAAEPPARKVVRRAGPKGAAEKPEPAGSDPNGVEPKGGEPVATAGDDPSAAPGADPVGPRRGVGAGRPSPPSPARARPGTPPDLGVPPEDAAHGPRSPRVVGHPARPAGAMIRRAGDEPAGDETMHAGAGEAGGGEAGGGEAGPDGEAAEAPAPDSERAGEQPPESARERLRRARQERRQRGASGPRPEGMGTRARDREQGTDEGDGAVPAHTGPSTGARPNVELLLQKQDLDEILEVKVPTDVHALSGLEPSDEYDGAYWGSADGSSYVAGLQIWRPHSPVKANSRYSRMVRSYPNAEETTAITNKTFLAYWNDIIYLVFFEPGKQTVVSLTCHKKVCNSPAKLVKLGLKVKERL